MQRALRLWHRWVSLAIVIPFSITLMTGLLLATRHFHTWVQPQYTSFSGQLLISFDEILKIARTVPEAQIQDWSDVTQIDVRPENANVRVRSRHNMWEIQIHGEQKKIMSSAPRRQSFLVSLHDGAYFGKPIQYGIFLVSSLGVLFLLISGIYLLVQHFSYPIQWGNWLRKK